jgi:hypothetical protein
VYFDGNIGETNAQRELNLSTLHLCATLDANRGTTSVDGGIYVCNKASLIGNHVNCSQRRTKRDNASFCFAGSNDSFFFWYLTVEGCSGASVLSSTRSDSDNREADSGWIAAGSQINSDVKVLSNAIKRLISHGLPHLANAEKFAANTLFEVVGRAQEVSPSVTQQCSSIYVYQLAHVMLFEPIS